MCLCVISSTGSYSLETGQNKDLAALIRTGPHESPSPAAKGSSATSRLSQCLPAAALN